MIRQISIKTKFGWISAFEEKGIIIRVKFGKHKNKLVNKNLKKFRSILNSFLARKNKSINFKVRLKGSSIQKKVWGELKKNKIWKNKNLWRNSKKI